MSVGACPNLLSDISASHPDSQGPPLLCPYHLQLLPGKHKCCYGSQAEKNSWNKATPTKPQLTCASPMCLTHLPSQCSFLAENPCSQSDARSQSPSLRTPQTAAMGQRRWSPQYWAWVHQCSGACTGRGPSASGGNMQHGQAAAQSPLLHMPQQFRRCSLKPLPDTVTETFFRAVACFLMALWQRKVRHYHICSMC